MICLANLYTQLRISNPRLVSNNERYLCNVIAQRYFKLFLRKDKKYALAKNYIALNYLKRMNLKSTNTIQSTLNENIKNISMFKKYTTSLLPKYSLNDFYKVYNDFTDFKKLLEIAHKSEDKDFDEAILKGFSIIFDIDKITMPLYYESFYGMQYMFWEIVVLGGLLKDMKLSAYLMLISLTNSGECEKEGQILTIEDEKITNLLISNKEFKNKLNSLLVGNSIDIEENTEFTENDLLLALHIATINIQGIKNEEGMWDLNIEISDRYDFTDIKNLKDYVKSTDSIKMSIFSSTLNNFAAISSSYNVIKPYNFVIKMNVKNYKID